MQEKKHTGWKKWIYVASVVLLASAAVLLVLAYILTGNTIRKGIAIEQTDVSWLTVKDAKIRVAESMEKTFPADKMTLVCGNRQWDLSLADIGYGYSVDETVEKAYSVGRNGNLFGKVAAAVKLLLDHQQFELETYYDKSKIQALLRKIKEECDTIEQDAKIIYEKGEIRFVREQNGKSLDIDSNMQLVENQLRKRDFKPVVLQVEERPPHIVYDAIKEIDGQLSFFSTRFNPGDVDRTDNIKLACSRLDGMILLPGEEFSMNEALGPRTSESGYKEAPVIIKNELTEGMGGGVCQVSSTLYNTVLLAGLEVTERTRHSMILTYISPGRDATITEDSIDFRFKNSTDYPVCLQADVTGDEVDIRMLGKKRENSPEIRLKTETLAVYQPEEEEIIPDDTLPAGSEIIEKKAVRGLRVALYKETYLNGDLTKKEKLTEDYYKPIRGKVRLSRDLYEARMRTQMQLDPQD